MTIRQRIFFSNMIMFIFLIVYFFGIIIYSFRTLTDAFKSYSEGNINKMTGDMELSPYEVQTLSDTFAEIAKQTEGKLTTTDNGKAFVNDAEKSGTLIVVTLDGVVTYVTKGYKYDTVLFEAEKLIGAAPSKNMTVYKEEGYFFDSTFITAEAKTYQLVMVNPSINISKTTGQRSEYITNLIQTLRNNVQSFMFIGAVAIIIINLVLVTIVTNSIMKPLNQLKEASQKIFKGNLDFTIDYGRDDEIAEVLESFEDMRQQLQESREEQLKYEDNRKRLIAGISHDLRTPLTSIKGYVSGLLDGIADTDEKRETYLKTIYSTADDMDKLVDDLFLFSRLDLDKLPFSFEDLDITEFMTLCCDEIKFSLEKKNVLLTYKDLCGGPVYVNIDRTKFARVLLNIADNTVKYKKNVIGNLYVTTEKLEEEKCVEIRMKDDGVGVDKEKVGMIFESFYRSDPARTNPVKGSGLGLAIAKQIVEAHGGKIRAESNIGEGLTIVIDLPYDEEKQTTTKGEARTTR